MGAGYTVKYLLPKMDEPKYFPLGEPSTDGKGKKMLKSLIQRNPCFIFEIHFQVQPIWLNLKRLNTCIKSFSKRDRSSYQKKFEVYFKIFDAEEKMVDNFLLGHIKLKEGL